MDVVGSIAESNCTRDANQHKINDPYPTPFPTGGFDLDALGIIHHQYPTNTFTIDNKKIFPCIRIQPKIFFLSNLNISRFHILFTV